MKARLRYYSKLTIQVHFLIEMTIHELEASEKYPDGIKYGLICKNMKTGDFVLMDNHHPKGPHVHINSEEFKYLYENDDSLIEDFKDLVFENLGVKL